MVHSKYYKTLALVLKGSGPHTAEHLLLQHFEISRREMFAGMLEP